MDSHEEYLELCAASTAGELTGEEARKLEAHVAVCASCRLAKQEFEKTVLKSIPVLAAEIDSNSVDVDSGWSVENAEQAFFKRLRSAPEVSKETVSPKNAPARRRFGYLPSRIPWTELWMPFAACAFLAMALGIVAYKSSLKPGTDSLQPKTMSSGSNSGSLEEQISDLGHERAQLLTKLAGDDGAIKDLKRELAEQAAELKKFREVAGVSQLMAQSEQRSASNVTNDSSRNEVATVQLRLTELQSKVDILNRQRDSATGQVAELEAKVGDLTQIARDRERALDQSQAEVSKQQELLDHDRDIRELMGARDLYIAEVHDVSRNGQTDKSYGRVFYTKGKSLIFYAYDLDAQPGLKNANTFQAWGRRGPDKGQALSLGIFFEDNASKKRWVLKAEDPKTLADIDAVFVTVEPNGGSHHPSGKQLLFAYLQVNPNHP